MSGDQCLKRAYEDCARLTSGLADALSLLREIRAKHDEYLEDGAPCDCKWCKKVRKLLEDTR